MGDELVAWVIDEMAAVRAYVKKPKVGQLACACVRACVRVEGD
jgi:hypothetical protein